MSPHPVTTPRHRTAHAAPPAKPAPSPTGKRPRDPLDRALDQHVARRIKLLRLLNGKSQTELGSVLGMTFQQVAKYERGFSRVTPDKLWRLADYFGIEINYFFDDFDRSAVTGIPAPIGPGRTSVRRLRLNLAASLHKIGSPRVVRSLLDLVRAFNG